MDVPPGNRRVLVSVPERYVAGADTRGLQEGRPSPWSQQVIHEISGLVLCCAPFTVYSFFLPYALCSMPYADLTHRDLESLLPNFITRYRFQRGEVQFCKPLLEVIISMPPDISQLLRCSMDAQPLGLQTGLLQGW